MRVKAFPRRRRGISLIAMTDVVFLLLLFFMVTSTFTRFAQIELSGGRTGTAIMETSAPGVMVRIDAEAGWEINGLATAPEDVAAEIARLAEAGAQSLVLLPRERVTTQQLVAAVETLRRASPLPVSLAR